MARYHHGDLRTALLRAAAEEVVAVGQAGVSLRALARRAGVSHAAPAHHFGDKRGLFTALAVEAFELLLAGTEPASHRPDALAATGAAYVCFALEHPAHFQVMWDVAAINADDPTLVAVRARAFDVLYGALRTGTGARDEGQVAAQGLAAWAAVHGIATLWLTGNMPYPRDVSAVDQAFADLAPALVAVARTTADQVRPAGVSKGVSLLTARSDRSLSPQPMRSGPPTKPDTPPAS